MKKNQRARHEFEYLKKQYPRLKKQAAETKSSKLWHLEAVLRGKIKALSALHSGGISGYRQLYEDYTALFREVSVRLLAHYNKTNKTDCSFEDVVKGSYGAYLNAGIISVLVTKHIPKLVAEEFKKLLPENPRDEYPRARKMKRKFILHLGETNTGKTYEALQRLKQAENGLYLAPLRILALENFERLNREGLPCSLLTGEEEIIIPHARHASCTVEKADVSGAYALAVIDEVQMLGDSQRGDAWTRAILGVCSPEIHLCGAKNVEGQLVRMIEDCGDDYEIREYRRTLPLEVEKKEVRLSDVRSGDALVAFSKRRVLSLSGYFSDRGIKSSLIYGDLPPEVRRRQYESFISGESRILISTDAIGMGVNLPIRRIVFTESKKFDGEEYRSLSSQEIKQISGRAGRIGLYETGYVASMNDDIELIESKIEMEDTEIESAAIGPSEVLLDIGWLPLKEKIALWSTREEKLSHYRKKDIRDYILILERLAPYKLSEADEWRLMTLPFDVNSEALLHQFISYVEERFLLRLPTLGKPGLQAMSLSLCEEYYQRLNLYYSFSKTMGMDFDEDWVTQTRAWVCEEINRLLRA